MRRIFSVAVFVLLLVLVSFVIVHGQGQNFPAGGSSSSISQFNVKTYGTVGDAQNEGNVTWSGSGAVTLAANNADNPWKSSDVGKYIWCNEVSTNINRLQWQQITSYTDANHIGVSSAPGAGVSQQFCVWGTQDDASAIQAAVNAAIANQTNFMGGNQGQFLVPANSTVYLPCGGYIIRANRISVYNTLSTNWTSPNFIGQGKNCVLIYPSNDLPAPADNTGWVMRFDGQNEEISDFTIQGSFNPSGHAGTSAFYSASGYSWTHDVNMWNVGSGTWCAVFSQVANARIDGLKVQNCQGGNGGVRFQQPTVIDVYNILASNSNGGNLEVDGCNSRAQGGTALTFHGGLIDESGGTTTQITTCPSAVNFVGTTLWTTGAGTVISVDGTSVVNFNGGGFVGPYNNNNNASAVSISSGGRVTASDTIFQQTGTGTIISGPAGAIFIDEGGNQWYCGSGTTACTASQLGTVYSGGIVPKASITHTPNTCYAVSGNLTAAAQNICNILLDQNYQLLAIAAQSGGTTPSNSSCTTAPVITMSDGTRTATMTMTTGKTSWQSGVDSTTNLNQIFASGALLTISIGANTCATPPANVSVTYDLQSALNP